MVSELQSEMRRANAAHWHWFRRLLAWVFLFSLGVFALALLYMAHSGTPLRWQLVASLFLGIVLSLMLGAGLMGLVFVSSRTGVDDGVVELPEADTGEER